MSFLSIILHFLLRRLLYFVQLLGLLIFPHLVVFSGGTELPARKHLKKSLIFYHILRQKASYANHLIQVLLLYEWQDSQSRVFQFIINYVNNRIHL